MPVNHESVMVRSPNLNKEDIKFVGKSMSNCLLRAMPCRVILLEKTSEPAESRFTAQPHEVDKLQLLRQQGQGFIIS